MSELSRMQTLLNAAAGDPPEVYHADKEALVVDAILVNNPQFWPENPDRTIDEHGVPSDASPEMRAHVFLAWQNQTLDNYLVGSIMKTEGAKTQALIEAELAKYV